LRINQPRPRAVDIWRFSFSTQDGRRAPERILSAQERDRANCFRFPRDRQRFVLSRIFLRQVLGSYQGTPPERIDFAAGPHGKPALADAGDDLRFNLSHFGSGCLVGVTKAANIGIDGEERRLLADLDLMIRRVLTQAEKAAVLGAPPDQCDELFLRLWTRKEAVLKAAGVGLVEAPDQVEVPAEAVADAVVFFSRSDGRHAAYRLCDISCGNVIAAVAVDDVQPATIQERSL
jgi:4'-phosphopantetheinyl transferase